MKRSKIFLSLTTVCLVVAGVVAAKVKYFGTSTAWYYTYNGRCVQGMAPGIFKAGGEICRSLTGVTYYTQKIGTFVCGGIFTYTAS